VETTLGIEETEEAWKAFIEHLLYAGSELIPTSACRI
jgi:hypothetical protein